MFGFGTTNSLTMDKPHADSLLDSGVQGVIGKPLDRIDGPLKVSGTATYAAEYQFDDMAYGVLVGTKISAGKVVSIDVDAVKSIPGVLDVVTDFDCTMLPSLAFTSPIVTVTLIESVLRPDAGATHSETPESLYAEIPPVPSW